MDQPTILPLRCPGCGDLLLGLQHDAVFWCRGCGTPQEVIGTELVGRRGSRARADAEPADRIVHLPIWALRVSYTLQCEDRQRAALMRQVPPIEWVYVTGFMLHNAWYFGDPGMVFTEKRVTLQPPEAADKPQPAIGCTRGLEAARDYVEPHLLAIIDRRVDVAGLTLQWNVSDAVLWAVPFHDEGKMLRDAIVGWRFPAAAVTGIGSIRGHAGGGGDAR